jgi:hypothetical protein
MWGSELTSRQAKHQAKRRSEGGVSITVMLLPNEPETKLWFDLVEKVGSPKLAFKYLLDTTRESI